MLTFSINIIGFIVVNILLAYICKECIIAVLPISTSGLTIILFFLCLIRHLSWIDYFFLLTTAAVILMGYLFRKKIDWLKLKDLVFDINNIIIVGMLLFIYVVAWNRVAIDSDELGVWALEVKTMFYVDGLSLSNMHTSIDYANYIPGQMLVEWWFCHLSPSQFNEGLMYFGYYSIYYFMLGPLIVRRNTQHKWCNFAKGFLMIPVLFVLPSAFCVHEYSMLSVELLISAVFSALMYSLFDTQLHTKKYIRIQWIALSILLVLLKLNAALFLMLAYLTALVLVYMDRKSVKREQNESDRTMFCVREYLNYGILVLGLVFSAVTMLIWQVAVRYYHRYGVFSTHRVLDNLKDILNNIGMGNVELNEEKMQYISSFKETVLHQPLHWNTTNSLDLTVISCTILILLVLYCVYRNQGFRNGRQEYVIVNCIAVGSIALFLLMLLFMYLYIFREQQYFDPSKMIKSLSRYAEPLFLGWSLTGFLMCLNSKRVKLEITVLILFLLCPSYTRLDSYFNNLQSNVQNIQEYRSQMRQKFGEFFREDEAVFGVEGQGRILFVYGGDEEPTFSGIRNFRYLAAPRSVYWLDYSDSDSFKEKIYNIASEYVCGFIYFEQIPEEFVQTIVNEYNLNPLGDYMYEILSE